MIGDEYSGPILKDRLYATYFYSREFKDVGNSPVSNYGTLTKVDFSNTGSNGVQFPDAYYDNIGSHHGIDVINNKFVSESGTHEIPGTSETVESVRGLPNVQFVIPTTNSDWQINYIDDENFSLTNRLNLIPGSASANQNATITIDDDYFFSGKNSEVFNLKGTYNIVQVSSAPVSIIPGAFGPSQGSEDDNRNIVVITIEQPATPFLGESTLGAQQYVSVMTYRDRVFLENVEQNHHPNQPVPTVDTDENPVFKSMTEDIVFTAFPKFIYKVDFSNDSNYGPGGDNENFRDIVTASSGLDSSFSTPGGEQKLRIKVTNTANGTRVSDADKIVVHLDQFMTQNQFADPALAYNIGDKIVMDYGVSRSIGEEVDNPAYGYTEGVTDFDTNNQGIYTITGFNLDANGNREVLVKDGEVTVNESRFDDTNTFGDGCTNIRRVNYLPRLEVNWTSATVPNYNGYVEGIIG